MKDKWHRLLALLTGIFLLLCGFWVLAEMPAFTAENAFYRVERAAFLQESTFLGVDFLGNTHVSGGSPPTGSLMDYAAVGKTDSALHVTELRKKPPFSRWYAEEEMVTIPLTGDLTAEFEPFRAEFHDVNVLVHTPLDFDRGLVTVTVEGGTEHWCYFTPTASGLVNVRFPKLQFTEDGYQIRWRQYDLRSVGYDESKKTRDVHLTVTLYDREGREIEQLKRVYPKYE